MKDKDDMRQASAPKEHDTADRPSVPLTLHLREDLAHAFRRCTWMIIHETGRTQPSIMEEMVRDFLVKHGC